MKISTKELILKAINSADEFVVHDGEPYVCYNRIEIKGKVLSEGVGIFSRKQAHTSDRYLRIQFYLDSKLVHEINMNTPVFFDSGDTLNILGAEGVIKLAEEE